MSGEIECRPGARHEFADDGGECLGCGRTFADWTHGCIRVDRMTLRENRESLAVEQRRVHQPDQEREARLWISILAPALRLKTNSPKRFAELFPYWEGRPAAERARSMEAGYVFRPREPKPMRIESPEPWTPFVYSPALGRSLLPQLDAESQLYGVTASDFARWKEAAERVAKWQCRFKKCLMLVSPDQVDAGHGLCDVHYIERLRVEGGAGIAPKHRYVTKPGEIRTVVTCDLGADWED